MKRITRLTRYGIVTVGFDRYVLLRPSRFEPEHYKISDTDITLYVAHYDESVLETFNPHYLTISNGMGFHIDYASHPFEVDVAIYEIDGEEAQPEEEMIEFRSIDMIAEADEPAEN
jgi:hypothetical protein